MKYFLAVCLVFFSACSIKNYTHTAAKILILKTPKIKFSDIAYIRNSDDAIELELFVAGKAVQQFHINHLVCVDDSGCMQKSTFNREYLNQSYPDDLLQNILLGKKIYNGKNLQKNANGFVQQINTQSVNIIYKVNTQSIYFKDRKNHILIKIKELNNG